MCQMPCVSGCVPVFPVLELAHTEPAAGLEVDAPGPAYQIPDPQQGPERPQ